MKTPHKKNKMLNVIIAGKKAFTVHSENDQANLDEPIENICFESMWVFFDHNGIFSSLKKKFSNFYQGLVIF